MSRETIAVVASVSVAGVLVGLIWLYAVNVPPATPALVNQLVAWNVATDWLDQRLPGVEYGSFEKERVFPIEKDGYLVFGTCKHNNKRYAYAIVVRQKKVVEQSSGVH